MGSRNFQAMASLSIMRGLEQIEPGIWRSKCHNRCVCGQCPGFGEVRRRKSVLARLAQTQLVEPSDNVLFLRAQNRPSNNGSKGVIRIRAYASSRIVLTAGQSAGPGGVAKRSGRRKPARHARSGDLINTVKLNEGFRVGKRLRVKPRPTRFTNHAQNWIRDAVHLIQREHLTASWFCTLTLAGGTQAAYDCVSAASGYIVNRMNRHLRDMCLGGEFVYIWELQERGAPHLHYLLPVVESVDQWLFELALQELWRRILLDVSSTSGVDLFARADGGTWALDPEKPFVSARKVWGSVEQYLAKYISKAKSKSGGRCKWYPGLWWGVSYPLRKRVLRERLDVKLDWSDDSAARGVAIRLAQAIAPVVNDVWKPDIARFFGRHVESVSVFVGLAKPLAEGLAELALTGDYTVLANLLSTAAKIPA